jgi:group I intron endonuclease
MIPHQKGGLILFVIYKLTEKQTKKIYIGMTTNLHRRLISHKSAKGRKIYGLEFDCEIIDRATDQKSAEKLEAFWIGRLKSYDENIGYNELIGRSLVDETRKKMSAAQLRRWQNEPNPFLGQKHTEATRKIMSEKKRGKRPQSAGWNKRQVKNLDTGEIFESAVIAQQKTGANRGAISKACQGKAKSAGGYRWQFVDP